MKKVIGIALALAIALILCFGTVALADDPTWDVEDSCVADNEDFMFGYGNEGGVHFGEQFYFPALADGYNLYQDDATDTGNLDSVFIGTYTPGEIDLPIIAEWGTIWYMGDENPDTWYWGTEPRGYNKPSQPPELLEGEPLHDSGIALPYWDYLKVQICGERSYWLWADEISEADRASGEPCVGKTLAEEVNATGICSKTYELHIPDGTIITGQSGCHVCCINIHVPPYPHNGRIIVGPTFLQLSEVATLYKDGEVMLEFNQIVAGVPSVVLSVAEVIPASSLAGFDIRSIRVPCVSWSE